MKRKRKITKEGITNRERRKNSKVYNAVIDFLRKHHLGKYAVIANGKLQDVGTFEEMKFIVMDANHRFIFEIKLNEDNEEMRLPTLRLPDGEEK